MLAVGEYYLSPLPSILVRASTPLGGGVGLCRQEICGALSGGILILGALWGRTDPAVNDDLVQALTVKLRDRFLALYGHTACQPVRDLARREDTRCLPVVDAGVRAVVEIIEEARREHPFTDRG